MQMNFNEALKYAKSCRINGYNDWRIPTIQEWMTILSYNYNEIDSIISDTNESYYWSSTIGSSYSEIVHVVFFPSGYIYFYHKDYSFHVKCVRGGKYDKLGFLKIKNLSENEELFIVKEQTIVDNRTGLEWTSHQKGF